MQVEKTHLDARIDLQEVVPAVLVHHELHRPSILVAHMPARACMVCHILLYTNNRYQESYMQASGIQTCYVQGMQQHTRKGSQRTSNHFQFKRCKAAAEESKFMRTCRGGRRPGAAPRAPLGPAHTRAPPPPPE